MALRSANNGRARCQRAAAALMVVVVFVASFAIAAREPSAELSRKGPPVSEFVNYSISVPKPCQKAVVPGAVNACSLSNISFNAIPAAELDYAIPAALHIPHWRISNSSLRAQCGGFSPYRPPCLTA